VDGAPIAGDYAQKPPAYPRGAAGAGYAASGPDKRLPTDMWQNTPFARFRDAALKLKGEGRSPALNDLLARALLDEASMPRDADPQLHDLLKMVVLYRMGRIADLLKLITGRPEGAHSLAMRIFHARALLASGEKEKACRLAEDFPIDKPGVGKEMLSEALMMGGLCAGMRKDLQAVGLIAEMARDKGVGSPLSLAVMDFLVSGIKPDKSPLPEKIGVRDFYFLRLTGPEAPRKILDMAEPALIYALAHDRQLAASLRLEAAERASKHGQIKAPALAAIYGEVARGLKRAGPHSNSEIRALLFDALARSGDVSHQARVMETLLANARKVRLSQVIGPMLTPFVRKMRPSRELDWFATRAVEVALLSHDWPLAEKWLSFVRNGGRGAYEAAEWLPLVNMARARSVPMDDGAQMALRMGRAGRLKAVAMRRLTSVMDALGWSVPIPLWNMAAKMPQPTKGYLPRPGALSRLKQAADRKDAGSVLLEALEVLGAHGADEMNLLAIGDIVRALKKAGFEREAGWFGFEALYGVWPTGARRRR
jgi:hypothetical protein